MRIRKAANSKMLPHVITVTQWALLIVLIGFNINIAVAVTGAVAEGGLKVLMLFHVWILVFSTASLPMFFKIRKEGSVEKGLIGVSIPAVVFSFVNVSLHYVDDLALLMTIVEVIAWSLYNVLFALSVYKIAVSFSTLLGQNTKKSPANSALRLPGVTASTKGPGRRELYSSLRTNIVEKDHASHRERNERNKTK